MRASDFFCGAGGASRGLTDAGFDVTGYDHWQPAVDTHNANGLLAHLHDLSDPSRDFLLDECDLAWFSTPCQPFSAAGDGDGEFDGRDGFPWALRILGRLLPSVAIFENVKGLTFRKHHAYLAGVIASIRALGYHVEHKVLNCADYGVPQTRERFIMVARRDGGVVTWPSVTHTETAGMFTEKWCSMAEALGWGGGLGWKYSRGEGMEARHGERHPHPFSAPAPAITTHAYKDFKVVLDRRTNSTYADGVGPTAVVAVDRPAPAVVTSNGQWLWVHDRPATTIAGDTRVFQPGGHHEPGEQSQNAIRVSIDEFSTLQGFPVGWQWTGTKTDQARQIGNAVPPKLAQVVAEANLPIMAVAS